MLGGVVAAMAAHSGVIRRVGGAGGAGHRCRVGRDRGTHVGVVVTATVVTAGEVTGRLRKPEMRLSVAMFVVLECLAIHYRPA